MTSEYENYMVRATASNGRVRAFAATTRGVVEEARKLQELSKTATAALGRVLTAGGMMACMMKGVDDRLTILFDGDGPLGSVTVTAKSDGTVKGCVGNPYVEVEPTPAGKLNVGGGIGAGTLRVIADLGLREPYIGTVPIQSGEVAEDIAYYYATSEQVPSAVALGVLLNDDDTVRQAGGFIVQMMPDASDEDVDLLEARLQELPTITELLARGLTPEDILNEVLEGIQPEFNDTVELGYLCDCSRERVEKALVALGTGELQEMIDDGETVEVHCDFCGKNYDFDQGELEKLLVRATTTEE